MWMQILKITRVSTLLPKLPECLVVGVVYNSSWIPSRHFLTALRSSNDLIMEVLVHTPTKKKRRVIPKSVSISALAYEHKLSFYRIPPTEELTVEEFERFALDRLKGCCWLPTTYSFQFSRKLIIVE
jgi:hypothetical protein